MASRVIAGGFFVKNICLVNKLIQSKRTIEIFCKNIREKNAIIEK